MHSKTGSWGSNQDMEYFSRAKPRIESLRRKAVSRLRRVRWGRVALITSVVLVVLTIAGTGLVVGMALSFSGKLPDVTALYTPPSEATRIFARDGQLIASLFRENRAIVPLDRIPTSLQQAVLAIEDDRFFQHRGIDARGMVRALFRNLLAGELIEGGSTITQQLARTVFLSPERVVSRKMAEMLLAVEIERRLTKGEILERYLNEVYFGHGAYGAETAARVFFGKPVGELTLSESAMLAGLIRAPSVYSPYRSLPKVVERQRLVLRRMADLGYVSREAAMRAGEEALALVEEGNLGLMGSRAPYFVSYILPYLLERYGEDVVHRGGLQVYTTLDLDLQAVAQEAVRQGIDLAQQEMLNVTQGALVSLEPQTGYIRAMIGGYDFAASQFNRAWQARRQPGSAFKPFVYVTAVASGMPPTKVIVDEPIEYETPEGLWQPRNYTEEFAGPIQMRQALERSINIPAIRTLEELGPRRVISFANRMGITSPMRPDLSLALGSSEVTPLELTSAYGVFAALGVRAEPVGILRIEDRSGKVLEEHTPRREMALSPAVAYVMTDILKGVIIRGTGRGANLDRPLAGKTGTTDDYRSAWFIGFTPQVVTGVWVGNDDNSPTDKVVGASVPLRIWRAFMLVALERMPEADWEVPPGVTIATVCGTSGLLATASCDDPRQEAFISGTEPTEYMLGESSEVRLNRSWPPGGTPPGGTGTDTVVGGGDRPAPPQQPQPFMLQLTTPMDGQTVTSPFTIEGATVPGARVEIAVTAETAVGEVETTEAVVGAMRDGRFKYMFWPRSGPAVKYTIRVRAHVRGGEPAQATITVVEPSPPPSDGENTNR